MDIEKYFFGDRLTAGEQSNNERKNETQTLRASRELSKMLGKFSVQNPQSYIRQYSKLRHFTALNPIYVAATISLIGNRRIGDDPEKLIQDIFEDTNTLDEVISILRRITTSNAPDEIHKSELITYIVRLTT